MKKRFCALPPMVTMALVLGIFAVFSLYPFSELTLAWCDMKQQVIPLLIDFQKILRGEASFFLNLQNAGGMSFLGVFFFFLSSPFSFLAAFVSAEEVYWLVNLLVLFKMMACAFTASLFFRACYPALGAAQNTALSVMYAFCGYTMLYFQNIVWLDMMYLFPLLLLGLKRLVVEGKITLFTLAFAAAVVVHFYLTYMVSLFLILGVALYGRRCLKGPKRRRMVLLLFLSVVSALAMTAVVWVPLLCQYASSARTTDLLTSLSSGGLLARWETTSVTVLSTMILFAALPALLMLRGLRTRRTGCAALMLLLTMVPLVLEPVNKMWHTGSYQAFPSRYGYITVMCGLILTAEVICGLNRNDEARAALGEPAPSGRAVFLPCLVLITLAAVLIGVVLLTDEREALSVYMRRLWFDTAYLKTFLPFAVLALVLYLLLFALYRLRLLSRRAFSSFLCAVALCEAVFSGCIFFGFAANDISYNRSILDLSGRIEDDGPYRVKLTEKIFDVNLVGSLGYGSLNHYTSFTDRDYIAAIKKLGYSSYWMETSSVGGTYFSDLLLGQRYEIDWNRGEEALYSNDWFSLRESRYRAPFGMVISAEESIETGWPFAETARLPLQNTIFQSLFSTEETLVTEYPFTNTANVEYFDEEIRSFRRVDDAMTGVVYYRIDVEGTQALYFDCFHEISVRLREAINGACNVYVNGQLVEEAYPTQKNNGILSLGTFTDESVLVELELLKDVNARSLGVYGMDLDVLDRAVGALRPASVRETGRGVAASVTADTAQDYLFLPLPYYEGYSATVNGKAAQAQRVFDDFVAVPLEKGQNEVALSYLPAGLLPGAIASLLGLALFLWLRHWLKRPSAMRVLLPLQRPVDTLFRILAMLVFFVIYLFPLLVYAIAWLKMP